MRNHRTCLRYKSWEHNNSAKYNNVSLQLDHRLMYRAMFNPDSYHSTKQSLSPLSLEECTGPIIYTLCRLQMQTICTRITSQRVASMQVIFHFLIPILGLISVTQL